MDNDIQVNYKSSENFKSKKKKKSVHHDTENINSIIDINQKQEYEEYNTPKKKKKKSLEALLTLKDLSEITSPCFERDSAEDKAKNMKSKKKRKNHINENFDEKIQNGFEYTIKDSYKSEKSKNKIKNLLDTSNPVDNVANEIGADNSTESILYCKKKKRKPFNECAEQESTSSNETSKKKKKKQFFATLGLGGNFTEEISNNTPKKKKNKHHSTNIDTETDRRNSYLCIEPESLSIFETPKNKNEEHHSFISDFEISSCSKETPRQKKKKHHSQKPDLERKKSEFVVSEYDEIPILKGSLKKKKHDDSNHKGELSLCPKESSKRKKVKDHFETPDLGRRKSEIIVSGNDEDPTLKDSSKKTKHDDSNHSGEVSLCPKETPKRRKKKGHSQTPDLGSNANESFQVSIKEETFSPSNSPKKKKKKHSATTPDLIATNDSIDAVKKEISSPVISPKKIKKGQSNNGRRKNELVLSDNDEDLTLKDSSKKKKHDDSNHSGEVSLCPKETQKRKKKKGHSQTPDLGSNRNESFEVLMKEETFSPSNSPKKKKKKHSASTPDLIATNDSIDAVRKEISSPVITPKKIKKEQSNNGDERLKPMKTIEKNSSLNLEDNKPQGEILINGNRENGLYNVSGKIEKELSPEPIEIEVDIDSVLKYNSTEKSDAHAKLKSPHRRNSNKDSPLSNDIALRLENANEQSLTQMESYAEILKCFHVCLPFEPPESHRIETRMSSVPTKEQAELFKNLNIEMRLGPFTAEEDKIIEKNWKSFCRCHGLQVCYPDPFLNFQYNNISLLNKEERIKFVQFLGKGLPNRKLYSIYKRFQKLFATDKKGRFTSQEDQIILNYVSTSNNANVYAELSKILNRSRANIIKRYRTLQINMKLNETVVDVVLSVKDYELIEKMIGCLLEATLSTSVEELKNRCIRFEEWLKLEQILDVPHMMLKDFWENRVYPRIFIPQHICLNKVRMDLIKMLHDTKETDWRKLDWHKLAQHFEGFTNSFLYKVFKRLVYKYNLQDFSLGEILEYLKTNFMGKDKTVAIDMFKYVNGKLIVLKRKCWSEKLS